MKRVTLADVAAHSGVSKMTVSCVVRGVKCVKEDTRKRVESSIAALGYRADPMLRSLAAYRSRVFPGKPPGHSSTLAYLDCDSDEYSLSMFRLVKDAAEPLGYDLKHFNLPRRSQEQRGMSRRLWLMGIRGLLFGPSREERPIGGFQTDLFSMVGIGAFHHSPAIDAVGADYFQGLYLAASRCYKSGARRIALVIPDYLEARTGHRWLGAYLAFCQDHGLPPRLGPASRRWVNREFVTWARLEEVDAILGLQGLLRFQRHLPKVLFAGLNDWQAFSDGGHVHIPQELIAREAIGILDYNLLHRRYGIPSWPKHISIEGKWRDHLAEAGC